MNLRKFTILRSSPFSNCRHSYLQNIDRQRERINLVTTLWVGCTWILWLLKNLQFIIQRVYEKLPETSQSSFCLNICKSAIVLLGVCELSFHHIKHYQNMGCSSTGYRLGYEGHCFIGKWYAGLSGWDCFDMVVYIFNNIGTMQVN